MSAVVIDVVPIPGKDSNAAVLEYVRRPSTTRSEALAMLHQVVSVCNVVKAQLSEARAEFGETGARRDPDWYRRASGARAMMAKLQQQIQLVISEKTTAEKAERIAKSEESGKTVDRRFMLAARMVLTGTQYQSIVDYMNREEQRQS
jgi:hypothetical protein